MTPGPVRKTIRRIPELLGQAGRRRSSSRASARGSGDWINKEELDRVKVILTQDVAKLGKSGEMKKVADGFATNFLIPQKLAVPAAGGAYRAWQHDIASREDKRKREREDAEIAATRIASTTLTMGVKVGEGGKLYGSITAKDIADALGPPRHRGRPPQGRPRGAAQVPRHVQGRGQGLPGHDARGHGRRRAQGVARPGGADCRGPHIVIDAGGQ